MEMNYFKKTGKMMVAACMLAGLPFQRPNFRHK